MYSFCHPRRKMVLGDRQDGHSPLQRKKRIPKHGDENLPIQNGVLQQP